MEIKYTKSALLYLFLLACGQSCGEADNKSIGNENVKIETYDKYRTQHLEYRDSLLVFYTVNTWSKINWDIYGGDQRMYRMEDSDIKYFIGGTFYSPDKLKLITWVGTNEPNAESREVYDKKNNKSNKLCPSSSWDIVYGMSALVGFRNSVDEVWMLYPLDNQMADCCRNKEKAINIMGQYYFEKMKGHSMWRLMQSGPQKGEEVSTPYGYNLQDKGFWEKCWLWEKDTITADGLYPFQKKGYNHIGYGADRKMRADPVIPPKIEYPDYILKLFR